LIDSQKLQENSPPTLIGIEVGTPKKKKKMLFIKKT